MRRGLVFACLLLPFFARGQEAPSYPVFETDKLPNSLYRARREKVKGELGFWGAAILFTNPERNRSNDTDFRFRPDSNFWYLTGFEEPDAALVLAPGGITIDGRTVTEVMLVNESDAESETWLGYRMGSQGARKLLEVEMVLPNTRFGEVLDALSKVKNVELWRMPDPEGPTGTLARMVRKEAAWRSQVKAADRSLIPLLNKMRVKKSPEEIELIRKAADASVLGHMEAMRSVRPGMREYELQAIVEYVFTRQGCESVAYNSIVGSGPNSCILHYEADRRQIQPGEIICMDVAGEYHGYAADVTRSFPASGKFSKEQRAIYDIVYAAQEAGIQACKPGAAFNSAHKAASEKLFEGLSQLGIIKTKAELDRYFMHGTSHYVGLDVHDAHGDNVLQDGYVLTVEPGIYIKAGSPCDPKWWNIGVRIEDDILVTKDGPVNLSAGVPRDPKKIEALMRERGLGDVRVRGPKTPRG